MSIIENHAQGSASRLNQADNSQGYKTGTLELIGMSHRHDSLIP
ncbi:hypothetical protein [Nitrosomonas marina]|nr:hypothetical protein [Nitrosomonas marina]